MFTNKPLSELLGQGIRLREIRQSDAEAILLIRNDNIVNTYVDRAPTKNLDESIAFINSRIEGNKSGSGYYWVISLENDQNLLGTICLWNVDRNDLSTEVGFELFPQYQKKGIMRRALQLVMHFGFDELDLHKINAYVHPKNKDSINRLLRSGFKNTQDPENTNLLKFEKIR